MSVNRRKSHSFLKIPTPVSSLTMPKMKKVNRNLVEKRKTESEFSPLCAPFHNKRASFIENTGRQITVLERSSTYNQKKPDLKSPLRKEGSETKAKPFKRKLGFYVKKSDK